VNALQRVVEEMELRVQPEAPVSALARQHMTTSRRELEAELDVVLAEQVCGLNVL
jgi:hypothetical protein